MLVIIFTNKACAFIFCRHCSFTVFLQNRDVGNESNVIHWTYNDYLWTALMAPRAGCMRYHLWCTNPVLSGVKVDKSQALIPFSLFLCFLLLFSLSHFIFNFHFRCVMKALLSNYCFIYMKVKGLAQDWTAEILLSLQGFRKALLGIAEGLLDLSVDSTIVWCEYGIYLNIWDTSFVQVVNILWTCSSGRINWPSGSGWTTFNGDNINNMSQHTSKQLLYN